MNATDKIDAARIDLALSELRLPGIKLIWAALAVTADKEGWPAARFLAALTEQEMAERSRRRFERHLQEARLPPGKTLDGFDFTAVPMISKAQVQALAAGDAWLEKGANLLCFGPPESDSYCSSHHVIDIPRATSADLEMAALLTSAVADARLFRRHRRCGDPHCE
jgi:hypothetical protein